jgi:AcrR family transcriptional regulator
MTAQRQRSTARRELVSNRILDEAAALFAERGFSETSLQEVADALQISRTALYHYIGSKDELLATLVRGLSRDTAESLERLASDSSLKPVDKLHAAIRDMTLRMANNPARFRMLLLSEGSLGEPLASEHRDARRRTLEALASVVGEGAASGALRPVDRHVAAFALIGMCNWVAWWYRSGRIEGQTPETVADAIAEIGIEGLRASADRAVGETGDSVDHALRLLRGDLDLLELAVASRDQADSPTPRRRRR